MNYRTLEKGSHEYQKLEVVAALLQTFSPHFATYEVRDVYFDLGEEWMWTTICRKGWHECQVLSPRQWDMIMDAKTPLAVLHCFDDIREDKFFTDK